MTQIPESLTSDPDDRLSQAAILSELVGNQMKYTSQTMIDVFNGREVRTVPLKKLKKIAKTENAEEAANMLSRRSQIEIGEEFQLKVGTGKVMLEMENTMLDYMLVVGNRIGLSAMLPNTANALQFTFDMDLKKPRKAFKGKHGMVGFDTRGRMLYIGQSRGEDIFLAMAPKTFLKRTEQRCASGYSSGPSQMSRRHARQVILMVIHFLGKIEALSYVSYLDPYEQDLDCDNKEWEQLNSAL